MEIGALAAQIFGPSSVESVFSVGQAAPHTPAQETARVAIRAQNREINRIRGYKLELTPTENKQLLDIKADIQEIDRHTSQGIVRDDEIETRGELIAQADEIIGKPTVDIEADEALAELAAGLDALLYPKLSDAVAKRVAVLGNIKDSVEESLSSNPESVNLIAKFQNLVTQIDGLTTPRSVSSLSESEKKIFDDLAELINDHVGAKIQLSSKESIRVAALERTIIDLQQIQPPDAGQQPSPQDVARAYGRLL